MSNTITADQLAIVVNPINEAIDRLSAAMEGPEGEDNILAWDNGLGVLMVTNPETQRREPRAVSYDRAQAFSAAKADFAYPVVLNGHRETAKVTKRKDACARQIVTLREAIADFQSRV